MQSGHRIITIGGHVQGKLKLSQSHGQWFWAKRNLKIYPVPPFISQMPKLRPISFFSGCTVKFKTTIQGFNKESFYYLGLSERKKKTESVLENRACFITRMNCHWFLWCLGGWKPWPKGLSSLRANQNSLPWSLFFLWCKEHCFFT